MKKIWLCLLIIALGEKSFSQQTGPGTLQSAQQAFEDQQWTAAASLLDPWLQLHPEDQEAYWLRGQIFQVQRLPDRAINDFNMLLTLNPSFSEAYFERGRARFALKQYQEAIQDFENFLQLPPSETDRILYRVAPSDTFISGVATIQSAGQEQAYYHLGLCSIALQEYDFAIFYLNEAIILNPQQPDFYAERGRAMTRLGENVAAIESYEKALDLDPDHLPARQGLAMVKTGGDTVLLAHLDQVIAENSGNSQTYKQRGFYRMSHNEDKRAIEDFSRAISLDPKDSESFFYRGKVHTRLKAWANAESDYSEAIGLDPVNPEYLLARGQLRYVNGQLEEALADFTEAIGQDPDFATGYYHRGITFQRMGRVSEACSELLKAKTLGMEAAATVLKKVCKED